MILRKPHSDRGWINKNDETAFFNMLLRIPPLTPSLEANDPLIDIRLAVFGGRHSGLLSEPVSPVRSVTASRPEKTGALLASSVDG